MTRMRNYVCYYIHYPTMDPLKQAVSITMCKTVEYRNNLMTWITRQLLISASVLVATQYFVQLKRESRMRNVYS